MAFNGAGTFQLVTGNPVVSGTTVSPTVHNNTNSDIANGLTNCVTRDGQSPLTSNLPMGGFKLTGLSAGTANGNSVRYEELIAEQSARIAADALLAPLASPSLTGVPLAPTAAPGTNTTQVATTEFSAAAIAAQSALDAAAYVALTGAQTVAGVKTFSSSPIVPAATLTGQAVNFDQALGIGQTWQDVTGSRASATTYYNTTGKPIAVCITTTSIQNPSASLTIGGVVVAFPSGLHPAGTTSREVVTAIVPVDASYSCTHTGCSIWAELR